MDENMPELQIAGHIFYLYQFHRSKFKGEGRVEREDKKRFRYFPLFIYECHMHKYIISIFGSYA